MYRELHDRHHVAERWDAGPAMPGRHSGLLVLLRSTLLDGRHRLSGRKPRCDLLCRPQHLSAGITRATGVHSIQRDEVIRRQDCGRMASGMVITRTVGSVPSADSSRRRLVLRPLVRGGCRNAVGDQRIQNREACGADLGKIARGRTVNRRLI